MSAIRKQKTDAEDKIECFNAVSEQFYTAVKTMEKNGNHSPVSTRILSKCFSVEIADMLGLPLDIVHESRSVTTTSVSDEYKSVIDSRISSGSSTIYNGSHPDYTLFLENEGGRSIQQCIEYNGARYVRSKRIIEKSKTVLVDVENIDSKHLDPDAVAIIRKVADRMLKYKAKKLVYNGKLNMKNLTIEEENKMPRNAVLSTELINRPCVWADGVVSCPSKRFPSSFDSIIENSHGGRTTLQEFNKTDGVQRVAVSSIRSKTCSQHPVMRTLCDLGSDAAWNAAMMRSSQMCNEEQ